MPHPIKPNGLKPSVLPRKYHYSDPFVMKPEPAAGQRPGSNRRSVEEVLAALREDDFKRHQETLLQIFLDYPELKSVAFETRINPEGRAGGGHQLARARPELFPHIKVSPLPWQITVTPMVDSTEAGEPLYKALEQWIRAMSEPFVIAWSGNTFSRPMAGDAPEKVRVLWLKEALDDFKQEPQALAFMEALDLELLTPASVAAAKVLTI